MMPYLSLPRQFSDTHKKCFCNQGRRLEFSLMAENTTNDNCHHKKLVIFSFQDSHLLLPSFASSINPLRQKLLLYHSFKCLTKQSFHISSGTWTFVKQNNSQPSLRSYQRQYHGRIIWNYQRKLMLSINNTLLQNLFHKFLQHVI